MQSVFYVASILVMAAVVIVLARGLWNLMKGGDANKSNKLMQMRIMLQLFAVVLIVITIILARGGR